MSFSDLGLRADLLKGLEALGFETPTEIQEQVIPAALGADFDLMALAQTGTGKTAAFGLPLLHNLDANERHIQALVMCPTRELCIQVASDLESYARFAPKTNTVAVYGGASIMGQIREIRRGVQVIVATPGRLIDLINRGEVKLDQLRVVVMDEADEMLNMGFRDDIEIILGNLPEEHATWLFSATMSRDVNRIAKTYMKNPTTIGQETANQSNENIDHGYYVCKSSERYETLKRVLDSNPGVFGLVFCQTKREVQGLTEELTQDGYNVDAIHGDLSQADRDRVMNRFRSRRLDLLIATDVAARGIDVDNISHVINFGFPYDTEAYTHRSGRTGRAGRTGVALSIVTAKFEQLIRRAGRAGNFEIERREIPKKADIMDAQMKHFIAKIKETDETVSDFAEVMPTILDAVEDMTKEQLLVMLAARELGDLLGFYKGKSDIFDGHRRDRQNGRYEDRGYDRDRNDRGRSSRGRDDRSDRRDDRRGDRSDRYEQRAPVDRAPREPRRDARPERVERSEPRVQRASNSNTTRLFINLGKIDGFDAKGLADSIIGNLSLPKTAIVEVDLNKNFSHIDVDKEFAEKVMKGMDGSTIEGRLIRANEADSGGGGNRSRKRPIGGRRSAVRTDAPTGPRKPRVRKTQTAFWEA